MGADLLAILILVAVLAGGTKSGRAFIREAWKATGWQPSRKALQHHSGRAGAWTGRGIASAAQIPSVLSRPPGRPGRDTAAKGIWQTRRGPLIPLMWRGDADPGGKQSERPEEGGRDFPVLLKARSKSGRKLNPLTGAPSDVATVYDAEDLQRRLDAAADDPDIEVTTEPLLPYEPAPSTDDPGTGTSPAPASPAATAAAGAQGRNIRMTTHLAVNLEPPTTDGEFLESCNDLAAALKAFAEMVSTWAEGLGGLNLPSSVTNPLHQVSEGISEAASGASQSAAAFEAEFEDAREVASRGMKFTGQDAA